MLNYCCQQGELKRLVFYVGRACRPDQKYSDP